MHRNPFWRHIAAPALIGGLMVVAPAGLAYAQPNTGGIRVVESTDDGAYDYERVVAQVKEKVSPLQQHMQTARVQVEEKMAEAGAMLSEDNLEGAINKSIEALDAVTTQRDAVERSLYQARDFLVGELGQVKLRLAENLRKQGKQAEQGKFDENSEKILKNLADRIKAEQDPDRKARLTSQFRQLHFLAETKAMASRLDPKEQQLWERTMVLLQRVNQQLALISGRTELMFQRLERTKTRMESQANLINTAEGLRSMLGMFRDLSATFNSEEGIALQQVVTEMEGVSSMLDGKIDATLSDIEAEIAAETTAADYEMQAEMDGSLGSGSGFSRDFAEADAYLDQLTD